MVGTYALKVQREVLKGMGIIFLHSAHHSKPFRLLMGTTCNLGWRENDDIERVWTMIPSHPIAAGMPRYFDLPGEEVYAEPFCIPNPDEIVFGGWFQGGEIFRAGCCWRRENGKIFYFQPGHESYATYHVPEVQKLITNAVRWAKSDYRVPDLPCPNIRREVPGHV